MKVEGRTFIVSGGSSGLGLATVELLLGQKAHVAILDRSSPPETLGSSENVNFIKIDITELSQIKNAVDLIIQWSKDVAAPLGGVINCAGVAVGAKTLNSANEPHPLDLWDLAISVNLTGAFNLTRLVLQHLVKVDPEQTSDAERGVVIFVASAAAFEGQPGQVAYAASKGGLVSMTLPMARDLARHSVRVVTVAPGIFDSSMSVNLSAKARRSLENDGTVYPKRFGQPQEFAKTVGWILDCPFVNGEVIRLSGAGRLPAKL
ncbi:3-hydroxyacyl-CoA dehydrogenase [Crepidotus variabilis]|uniref:3-hydroxyacyl-CoA dehydrogenase n=1 Tax=Crepidotus variabilis TaxID=179855 RepID=A0A9P6E6C7_9AGAR|nr:3-hydroxyacyl-CoA dehydrogenase [Crepidotus variabilis]